VTLAHAVPPTYATSTFPPLRFPPDINPLTLIDGVALGVIAFDALDTGPVPIAFVAVTVNV
jgi:hypothetical protein